MPPRSSSRPYQMEFSSFNKNYFMLSLLILASLLTFVFLYSGTIKQDLIMISSPLSSQKRQLLDGNENAFNTDLREITKKLL